MFGEKTPLRPNLKRISVTDSILIRTLIRTGLRITLLKIYVNKGRMNLK